MSLQNNPLAAFGFGGTQSTQNWSTVINHIKNKCGVIGTFEFSDEAIVAELKTQVMPFYSIYDGYPAYQTLTTADIISTFPTRVYACKTPTQIIAVSNLYLPEYMYLTNLGQDSLRGFGGTSIDDFLIAKNWNDIQKMVIPEKSWKFIPPARLEIIESAGITQIYDIVIKYDTVHPDPSSINPTMFEDFKELCAGYMMLVIGTMREKTNGLSTPTGTFETTGTVIKQEGQQILTELKQKLITTPPDQMLHLW